MVPRKAWKGIANSIGHLPQKCQKFDLPKRLPLDVLYEPAAEAASQTIIQAGKMIKRLIRGRALTTMPSYRRIHALSAEDASELELDGDAWLPLYVQDAWQVCCMFAVHPVGKYNKTGT